MSIVFKKIWKGLNLRPESPGSTSIKGDLQVNDVDSKLHYHDGTVDSAVVTEAGTATLTNKTLTSPTITNATLSIDDTDSANSLSIISTSTLTANRTLTFDVDNANRTVEISGNLILTGDEVDGPASATSGTVPRWADSTGKLLTTSAVSINASNHIIATKLAAGIPGAIDASAIAQLDSTTTGFLPPRMTITQRDAISSPAEGLIIYNTTDDTVDYYTGSAWQESVASGSGQTLSNKNLVDNSTFIIDNADGTKRIGFNAGGTTSTTTTLTAAQTANRTITFPDATTTVVGTDVTQTLSNKSLIDNVTDIVDNADATKRILFNAGGTTSTSTTLTAAQTANRVITFPDATDTLVGKATTDTLTNKTLTAPVISTISNTGTLTLPTSTDTLVGRATTDTLTNKKLVDASTTIVDDGDNTKQIAFQASAITTGNTRTVTVPDSNINLAGFTKSAKTTTYSVLATDAGNILEASGASFTFTLPTIASTSDYIFKFRHNDSDLSRRYTISRAGANTFEDGSTSTTIDTQYEEVDIWNNGTNWVILRRFISGVTRSFSTPAITGSTTNPTKGTTNSDVLYWTRSGDRINLIYNYSQTAAGAAGSGTYSIALPTGLSVDGAKFSASGSIGLGTIGVCTVFDGSNAFTGVVQANASVFNFRVGSETTADGTVPGSTLCALSNTTVRYSAAFSLPITGWNG